MEKSISASTAAEDMVAERNSWKKTLIRKILPAGMLVLFVMPVPANLSAEDIPQPTLIAERTFLEVPETLWLPGDFSPEELSFLHLDSAIIGAEFLYRLVDVFPQAAMVDVYNGLLRYSEMQGLQYYSMRDDTMQTLINDSYRIAGPEDPTPLDDLQLERLIPSVTVFIRQYVRDFNEVIWQADYRCREGVITIRLRNTHPLSFGPFRIVDTGKFSVFLAAVADETDVLLYQLGTVTSSGMQLLIFLGLGEHLEASFFHRMKALNTIYSSSKND